MDTKQSTPNPLPPFLHDEHDLLLTGRRIGHAIWRAVNGPPLSERTVPEPLSISPTLRVIKGGRA